MKTSRSAGWSAPSSMSTRCWTGSSTGFPSGSERCLFPARTGQSVRDGWARRCAAGSSRGCPSPDWSDFPVAVPQAQAQRAWSIPALGNAQGIQWTRIQGLKAKGQWRSFKV